MNHVLLVEGSRDSALHLTRLLTRSTEIELKHAGSDAEALNLIMRQPVDLVIVDVQLPRIDGFSFCGHLHENETTQHIPVLILAALDGETYPEVKALALGPAEIYTLPTPGSSLVVWMKILLKLKSALNVAQTAPADLSTPDSQVYSTLLQAASNAILWAEADSGTIRIAGGAVERITGYSAQGLKGRSFWDLVPSDRHEELMRIWSETGSHPSRRLEDSVILRRHGTERNVGITLYTENIGGQDGIIISLQERDSTGVGKRDPQQLVEPGEFGDLVAALAHEIRNPLTGISTNVQYLQMTHSDSKAQREIYSDVMDSISRLDLIMREFVDYFRPAQPRLEKVDLNHLFSEALSDHDELIQSRRIELDARLGSPLPEIEVDAPRFRRALAGIVEYCANTVEEEGQIEAASRLTREGIILEISRNGKSLPSGALRQLFEPLSALKSRETGMGLALVERILKEHGCKIEVESQYGQRTRFKIIFPLHAKSIT